MSDRFALLRDYWTNFQRYRELRPDPCSIEEEYELHKRIAAAEEMAKALEAFLEAWDKSHQLEKTDVARRMAETSLAAYNALR